MKLTIEEFHRHVREAHVIGQQLVMVQMERTVDLDLPPAIGLLAIYEVIRMQIKENLKLGNLTRQDIRRARTTSDLLRATADLEKHYVISKEGTERVK